MSKRKVIGAILIAPLALIILYMFCWVAVIPVSGHAPPILYGPAFVAEGLALIAIIGMYLIASEDSK